MKTGTLEVLLSVNMCHLILIYLNRDFMRPIALSTTILAAEWALLNATSRGVAGRRKGVSKHFFSGYPESPSKWPK